MIKSQSLVISLVAVRVNIDVDTKANTSDQLAIAGNSTGTTKLAFTNITPGEETGVTITDVVTVAGTSSATDFSGSMLGRHLHL